MLDLARACRRLRTFTHISTAYVAGVRCGLIREDDLQDDHGFKNAYEHCKLEAERRVRRAMADLPIIVLRPGIIEISIGAAAILSTFPVVRALSNGLLASPPWHAA